MIVTRTCLRTYATIHAGCSTQVGRITSQTDTQFYYTIYRTFYTSFLSHVPLRFREPKANPMAQLLAWWRGVRRTPIQSGDPRGTGCPSTQQAQWTDKDASGHGETAKKKKKNFKPGTILVPYQGTSSLTVQPVAQLIQQHTSPSLTHNHSPRHITVAHLHHHRDT